MDDIFESLRLTRVESGSGTAQVAYVHRKCIPFAILVQSIRGSYRVSAEGRHITVAAGNCALIAADVPVTFDHRTAATGGLAANWLHIQAVVADALDPCALVITPHLISGTRAEHIGTLLGDLQTRTGGETADRFSRLGLAALALGEALSAAPAHPQAGERLATATRFAPLSTWLRANLHRPLTLDDIAEAAELSRSRLHALIGQHLKRTPMAWVKELRLRAAAHQLLTTDANVAAVAEATGFANPFHFSREFVRRYHAPPSRYRAQQSWDTGKTAVSS